MSSPQLTLLARPLAGLLALALLPCPVWAQSAADRYDYHFEAGNRAQSAWRHQEALAHYQKAVAAYNELPAGTVGRVDRLYYNLALANVGCGNLQTGLEIWKQVETWRTKNLGQTDPENIEVVNIMARIYSQAMDYENAYAYSLLYLKLCEKKYGRDAFETSDAVFDFAHVLMKWQNPKREIDDLLARGVAIIETHKGPRSYDLKIPLEMMAQRAIPRGEYRQAEVLLDRGKTLEPHKPINEVNRLTHLAATRYMYAWLYDQSGRLFEAEFAYREVLALNNERERLHPGAGARSAAGMYCSLGEVYEKMGLPDKALEHFRLAVDGYEKAGAADSHLMAFAMHGIAQAHARRGELREALEVYQESRKGAKRSHAGLPAHYAEVLRELGRYREAAEYLDDKLEKVRKSEGERSFLFREILEQQAELEAARGQREAADKLYERVVEWIGPSAGDPGIADARMGQARLAAAAGEHAQAIARADQARRELRRFAARVLPSLGESEQLEFLTHREAASLQESLAMALTSSDDRTARETAAAWVVNAKGLAQEAIAQRTLDARETSDPRQMADLRDWLAVRYRLARLALAADTDSEASSEKSAEGGSKRDREVQALTLREQTLAKRLGRSSFREKSDPWVELAAIREQVPAGSVLIEFLRFAPRPRRAKAAAEPARYLAWIIPPAGQREVRLVDLGRADAIDAAVLAARKPLSGAREAILEVGEAEAEKLLQKELAALSEKLLGPLIPHLAESQRWLISPDGSLWLVPWSALVLENKYLVESHVTSLLVSGRDLVELAGRKASGNPALVLADPDYDLADSPKALSAPAPGEVSVLAATADDPRTLATRSAAVRSAVSNTWARLPGTLQEAQQLEPKLSAYTGSTIELRTGALAAEATIRDAWQPRVAVLSTHGYFLDRASETTQNPALASPLVRCGLVLAGANRRGQAGAGKLADQADDGILTGLEIVGADLRGTELVVLSACETALGEVRAAEGVAGLRQAFQLAGAQSVLASLWRVPDADTAQLMTDFYESLASAGDKAQALAQAQRSLLARHRKQGAGHPYFWAAFTVTGRTDRPSVNAPQPRPARIVVRPKVQVISPAGAPIMDGPRQLAMARQGDLLEVAGEQGQWVRVVVIGQPKMGWVERKHVRPADDF